MSKDILAQSLQSKAVQDALDGKSKGFKRLLPFLGPAFIAAIAYIDPETSLRISQLVRNMGICCCGSSSFQT